MTEPQSTEAQRGSRDAKAGKEADYKSVGPDPERQAAYLEGYMWAKKQFALTHGEEDI